MQQMQHGGATKMHLLNKAHPVQGSLFPLFYSRVFPSLCLNYKTFKSTNHVYFQVVILSFVFVLCFTFSPEHYLFRGHGRSMLGGHKDSPKGYGHGMTVSRFFFLFFFLNLMQNVN